MIDQSSDYFAVKGGFLLLHGDSSESLYGFDYMGNIIPVDKKYKPPLSFVFACKGQETIYELAFASCMVFFGNGDNFHARNMLSSLASRNFKSVFDCVPASGWSDFEDVDLMGHIFIDHLLRMSIVAGISLKILAKKDGRKNRGHAIFNKCKVSYLSSAPKLGDGDVF